MYIVITILFPFSFSVLLNSVSQPMSSSLSPIFPLIYMGQVNKHLCNVWLFARLNHDRGEEKESNLFLIRDTRTPSEDLAVQIQNSLEASILFAPGVSLDYSGAAAQFWHTEDAANFPLFTITEQ